MSEKEKTILENLSKSLAKATDEQKEYLLGLADGMALMSDGKRKSKRKPKPSK
jgi:predicted transcriptional regulator